MTRLPEVTVAEVAYRLLALLLLPIALAEITLMVVLIVTTPAFRTDRWVTHTNKIWPNWQRVWRGGRHTCIPHTPGLGRKLATPVTAAPRSAGRPANSARSTAPRTRSCAPVKAKNGSGKSRTR